MILCQEAADLALSDHKFTVDQSVVTGSTDMGDLSCIMPVVHPYAAGCEGSLHSNDFEVVDHEAACISNAKFQLAMLLLLLGDNATRAKQIVAEFKPLFPSKEEFLDYIDNLNSSGDRIIYHEDGTAEVKL